MSETNMDFSKILIFAPFYDGGYSLYEIKCIYY